MFGRILGFVVVLLLFAPGCRKSQKIESQPSEAQALVADLSRPIVAKAEPKPEPKPEPKVEPKKVEPKPEPKVEPKKVEPKPEPKVEPKKVEPKPEPKVEPKKVEPKPEPKPEPTKPAPVIELKPEKFLAPTPAESAKTLKDIREIFKEDYAKKRTLDVVALSNKLLQQGMETKDDPNTRYVLLKESADLATSINDTNLALKAINEISKEYNVEISKMKAVVLEKAANNTTAINSKVIAEAALAAAEEAVEADDFDAATHLAKIANTAARKGKNIPLISAVQVQVKRIENFKQIADKVKKALDSLVEKPDDPAANLLVGKHFCFTKGDWEKGLPLLAKSGDAILAPLATKDLTGTEVLQAADGWYAFHSEPKAQHRALELYRKALDGLAGLEKVKVTKRISELAKEPTQKSSIKWEFVGIKKYCGELNNYGSTEIPDELQAEYSGDKATIAGEKNSETHNLYGKTCGSFGKGFMWNVEKGADLNNVWLRVLAEEEDPFYQIIFYEADAESDKDGYKGKVIGFFHFRLPRGERRIMLLYDPKTGNVITNAPLTPTTTTKITLPKNKKIVVVLGVALRHQKQKCKTTVILLPK
jgi:hypothetical protein